MARNLSPGGQLSAPEPGTIPTNSPLPPSVESLRAMAEASIAAILDSYAQAASAEASRQAAQMQTIGNFTTLENAPAALTPEQVAAALQLGRSATYEFIRRGTIPSFRVGRHVRIGTEQLRQFIANGGLAALGSETALPDQGKKRPLPISPRRPGKGQMQGAD